MRRTTALTHLVTCCALALALSGCGSANPKPAPPASESVTNASPSVVAPTMPAEAMGTGPEAAKAMVQLFIDRLDFAGTQGDTKAFREVFTSKCSACAGVADFIDQTYAAGGEIRGTGWHSLDVASLPPTSGSIKVNALVRVAPQSVIAKKGAEPKHFAGADRVMKHFTLEIADGNWRISDIEASE